MTYVVGQSDSFRRRAARFFKKHPDLLPRFERLVEDLCADPFQPRLRLHRLSGRLAGTWAVSLTYEYRVTLFLLVSENRITLLHIGTHDEVYG